MLEQDDSSVSEYLEELGASGVDLSHPVTVEHYLYFPLASLAYGAAEELRREGFDVDVEQEDDRDGWIAYATRQAQATVPVLVRLRERLIGAAVLRGGEYEGWNIVPFADEPIEDGDETEIDPP
jgi:hypothetical protein